MSDAKYSTATNIFKVEIDTIAGGAARKAAILKAVEEAAHRMAQKVLDRGNQMITSGSHTGRKYGAHQASKAGEPAAAGGGDGLLAKRTAIVDAVEGNIVESKARWTAPHAHLMEKGFMHKPHRPRDAKGRRVGKKKWAPDAPPAGMVHVPARPFARPAGMQLRDETQKALVTAAKKAAGGPKGPKR